MPKLRTLLYPIVLAFVLSGWLAVTCWRVLHSQLVLPSSRIQFRVLPGESARQVATRLYRHHVLAHPDWWIFYARISGQANHIQSGDYALKQGMNELDLLKLLIHGQTVQYGITFIDGWSFSQVMNALNSDPHVRHTLKASGYSQVIKRLGGPDKMSPEGWFFPNTYFFSNGASDLSILRRAYTAMRHVLANAWASRASGLPFKTPYDALILASIVEKETASAHERPLVAGVFINRLRLGMRLQSDPTVIYALGNHYNEHLTFKELRNSSPYNTYVHSGLPPTPISLPDKAVIMAVMHPAITQYLYFVATGKGNHIFSKTYSEQKKAVIKYQLDGDVAKYRANQAITSKKH